MTGQIISYKTKTCPKRAIVFQNLSSISFTQHVKINPALLLKANLWPRLNSVNSQVLTLPDVRLSPCVIRAGQCLGN